MASDRRGRNRNDPDGIERKTKKEPEEEQLQQQEEQQEAERRQEQQRDAAQDALGNQGVAAMLGLAGVKPGEAGLAAGAQQAPEDQQALQFGGEDDPEDGPLTLDDLVRSWNPTTRRGQDAPPGALGSLDGLPEEDQALLDAVRRDPTLAEGGPHALAELPTVAVPDPLVQPSEDLVLRDLRALVRQSVRWSTGSLVHRSFARLLSPPARCLVDPAGQLVHTRARVAAAATLLLLDGLGDAAVRGVSPVVSFTLELSARGGWIDRALDVVRERQTRLPQASDLLVAMLGEVGGADGSGPAEPPAAAAAQIRATLVDLLDVPSASTLLPSLSTEAGDVAEPDEDPLELDGLFTSLFGAQDPLAGVYDAALQGAERLAGGAARVRVHGAGLAAAVAEVCDQWSAGAPRHALAEIAAALDREVAEVLQLLVEIGRAIQARAVAPAGIRNGLRRVARGLDAAASRLVDRLVPVIGGVVPDPGDVRPPPVVADDDPLAEAWAEGTPAAALPWLLARPEGLERDVAAAFTRAAAGRDLVAEGWDTLAERAQADGRWALAGVLRLGAAAGRIRAGDPAGAVVLADRAVAEAFARRNGVWLAAAALVAIEGHWAAGDPERAEAVLRRAAGACWRLGARAGLTLLLRWRRPTESGEPT